MAMRERIAQGVSPDEAARQAELDFGNTVTVREVTSDMWNTQWLSQGIQDARYAVRSLLRVPGFALIAVLTLALGIGANTAIFSVINGVILRPLQFPNRNSWYTSPASFPCSASTSSGSIAPSSSSSASGNRAFQDVGAFAVGAVNVAADEAPQRVTSAAVSASLFNTLAVTPLQGRAFTSEETLPNAAPVVILSQELWQSAFGGRAVVGHQIDVNGVKRAVVGVMPAGFDVHDQGVKLWLPLVIDPADRVREVMWLNAGISRTAKGLRTATVELAEIEERLPEGATEELNLVQTAQRIVEGAMRRKESRGGHYRSDFPHSKSNWRGRHIEL